MTCFRIVYTVLPATNSSRRLTCLYSSAAELSWQTVCITCRLSLLQILKSFLPFALHLLLNYWNCDYCHHTITLCRLILLSLYVFVRFQFFVDMKHPSASTFDIIVLLLLLLLLIMMMMNESKKEKFILRAYNSTNLFLIYRAQPRTKN